MVQWREGTEQGEGGPKEQRRTRATTTTRPEGACEVVRQHRRAGPAISIQGQKSQPEDLRCGRIRVTIPQDHVEALLTNTGYITDKPGIYLVTLDNDSMPAYRVIWFPGVAKHEVVLTGTNYMVLTSATQC